MKKSLPVDRALLQKLLVEAEKNGPLSTQSDLWQHVAEAYNAKSDTKITPSVVYLRVKQWGLAVQTKSAGRGKKLSEEQKSAMQAARGNRVPRAEKLKGQKAAFECLRRATPQRFRPLVDRAAKGSIRAVLKLKCLDCCCFETAEVKCCEIKECSLYAFRPYQGRKQLVNEMMPEANELESNDRM